MAVPAKSQMTQLFENKGFIFNNIFYSEGINWNVAHYARFEGGNVTQCDKMAQSIFDDSSMLSLQLLHYVFHIPECIADEEKVQQQNKGQFLFFGRHI